LQKSTTTAITTVVSDTTLHRCPKYRKTCKSTSVPTDAATPSVVSAIQSTPTTKHCPIYRKSCNPKQQITTTTTTNNNNNNNNRPPESKKRKRHCAKKNRMKKQHIEEQLQLKKTKKTPPAVPGCKIYRKSCSPAKLEPKVQKPRCPKYRKSACINHTLTATVHAAAPTTSLAGDAESLTTSTGSTKPCNRFRLSCQKLLAHLDQSAK
ncbi:hypothetical protein T4E_6448, partial [Trichinella pseudospiralis]